MIILDRVEGVVKPVIEELGTAVGKLLVRDESVEDATVLLLPAIVEEGIGIESLKELIKPAEVTLGPRRLVVGVTGESVLPRRT